jgi:hypothetical protein
MHHLVLYTPCIALYVGVSYYTFALDLVEPEVEELQELGPVKGANLEQEYGKP